MWDTFLISFSKHPFFTSIIPIVTTWLITFWVDKKYLSRILLIFGLFISILVSSFLHLRWDSFRIHLLPKDEKIKHTNVFFLGDSITCEGIRPRGFITKLHSVLPFKPIVICKKGASTQEIIEELNLSKINLEPDLIVVQAGINDLLNGASITKTKKSQEKLLSILNIRFPTSKVVFVPIHPITKNRKSISIPFDIKSFWTKETNFQKRFLTSDGIHLNARGHTLLAVNIIKILA